MRSVFIFLAALLAGTLFMRTAGRTDPRTDCPMAEPCTIIILTDQEKKILLDERGILATAAQARTLDLSSLVTYFQQKIAKAPAGDLPPKPEAPKPVPPTPGDGTINLTPPDTTPK